MKGIALSTIAYILIAIVAISLLITYIGLQLSPSLRKVYCDFLFGLNSFLPLPSALKPSLPAFCETPQIFPTITIESGDVNYISRKIAEYSLACWSTTAKVELETDKICYEIVLKKLDDKVMKDNVTSQLPPDYRDIIDWKVGIIEMPKSVGIYYNATSKLIEVI
ncbi:MAG: hypothetical protein QXS48_01550 [Candidatus Aenigmatarchaeota archaeon]